MFRSRCVRITRPLYTFDGSVFLCPSVLQVRQHSAKAGPSSAGPPGPAQRGHPEWRHGDLPRNLPHHRLHGREPFKVCAWGGAVGVCMFQHFIAAKIIRDEGPVRLDEVPAVILTSLHRSFLPACAARTLLEQVDHWQTFLALVNMIMFCTGIPGHYPVNETTSSLTLTFWYTLQVRPCFVLRCSV